MKTYITDGSGYVHIAAHTVGDHGESRGVFNSDEWFSSTLNPVEFFRQMTFEEPVEVEEVEE